MPGATLMADVGSIIVPIGIMLKNINKQPKET